MNKLMIQSRIGESVNSVLIDLKPIRRAQFLSYVFGQRGNLNHFHRKALLKCVFPEA